MNSSCFQNQNDKTTKLPSILCSLCNHMDNAKIMHGESENNVHVKKIKISV